MPPRGKKRGSGRPKPKPRAPLSTYPTSARSVPTTVNQTVLTRETDESRLYHTGRRLTNSIDTQYRAALKNNREFVRDGTIRQIQLSAEISHMADFLDKMLVAEEAKTGPSSPECDEIAWRKKVVSALIHCVADTQYSHRAGRKSGDVDALTLRTLLHGVIGTPRRMRGGLGDGALDLSDMRALFAATEAKVLGWEVLAISVNGWTRRVAELETSPRAQSSSAPTTAAPGKKSDGDDEDDDAITTFRGPQDLSPRITNAIISELLTATIIVLGEHKPPSFARLFMTQLLATDGKEAHQAMEEGHAQNSFKIPIVRTVDAAYVRRQEKMFRDKAESVKAETDAQLNAIKQAKADAIHKGIQSLTAQEKDLCQTLRTVMGDFAGKHKAATERASTLSQFVVDGQNKLTTAATKALEPLVDSKITNTIVGDVSWFRQNVQKTTEKWVDVTSEFLKYELVQKTALIIKNSGVEGLARNHTEIPEMFIGAIDDMVKESTSSMSSNFIDDSIRKRDAKYHQLTLQFDGLDKYKKRIKKVVDELEPTDDDLDDSIKNLARTNIINELAKSKRKTLVNLVLSSSKPVRPILSEENWFGLTDSQLLEANKRSAFSSYEFYKTQIEGNAKVMIPLIEDKIGTENIGLISQIPDIASVSATDIAARIAFDGTEDGHKFMDSLILIEGCQKAADSWKSAFDVVKSLPSLSKVAAAEPPDTAVVVIDESNVLEPRVLSVAGHAVPDINVETGLSVVSNAAGGSWATKARVDINGAVAATSAFNAEMVSRVFKKGPYNVDDPIATSFEDVVSQRSNLTSSQIQFHDSTSSIGDALKSGDCLTIQRHIINYAALHVTGEQLNIDAVRHLSSDPSAQGTAVPAAVRFQLCAMAAGHYGIRFQATGRDGTAWQNTNQDVTNLVCLGTSSQKFNEMFTNARIVLVPEAEYSQHAHVMSHLANPSPETVQSVDDLLKHHGLQDSKFVTSALSLLVYWVDIFRQVMSYWDMAASAAMLYKNRSGYRPGYRDNLVIGALFPGKSLSDLPGAFPRTLRNIITLGYSALKFMWGTLGLVSMLAVNVLMRLFGVPGAPMTPENSNDYIFAVQFATVIAGSVGPILIGVAVAAHGTTSYYGKWARAIGSTALTLTGSTNFITIYRKSTDLSSAMSAYLPSALYPAIINVLMLGVGLVAGNKMYDFLTYYASLIPSGVYGQRADDMMFLGARCDEVVIRARQGEYAVEALQHTNKEDIAAAANTLAAIEVAGFASMMSTAVAMGASFRPYFRTNVTRAAGIGMRLPALGMTAARDMPTSSVLDNGVFFDAARKVTGTAFSERTCWTKVAEDVVDWHAEAATCAWHSFIEHRKGAQDPWITVGVRADVYNRDYTLNAERGIVPCLRATCSYGSYLDTHQLAQARCVADIVSALTAGFNLVENPVMKNVTSRAVCANTALLFAHGGIKQNRGVATPLTRVSGVSLPDFSTVTGIFCGTICHIPTFGLVSNRVVAINYRAFYSLDISAEKILGPELDPETNSPLRLSNRDINKLVKSELTAQAITDIGLKIRAVGINSMNTTFATQDCGLSDLVALKPKLFKDATDRQRIISESLSFSQRFWEQYEARGVDMRAQGKEYWGIVPHAVYTFVRLPEILAELSPEKSKYKSDWENIKFATFISIIAKQESPYDHLYAAGLILEHHCLRGTNGFSGVKFMETVRVDDTPQPFYGGQDFDVRYIPNPRWFDGLLTLSPARAEYGIVSNDLGEFGTAMMRDAVMFDGVLQSDELPSMHTVYKNFSATMDKFLGTWSLCELFVISSLLTDPPNSQNVFKDTACGCDLTRQQGVANSTKLYKSMRVPAYANLYGEDDTKCAFTATQVTGSNLTLSARDILFATKINAVTAIFYAPHYIGKNVGNRFECSVEWGPMPDLGIKINPSEVQFGSCLLQHVSMQVAAKIEQGSHADKFRVNPKAQVFHPDSSFSPFARRIMRVNADNIVIFDDSNQGHDYDNIVKFDEQADCLSSEAYCQQDLARFPANEFARATNSCSNSEDCNNPHGVLFNVARMLRYHGKAARKKDFIDRATKIYPWNNGLAQKKMRWTIAPLGDKLLCGYFLTSPDMDLEVERGAKITAVVEIHDFIHAQVDFSDTDYQRVIYAMHVCLCATKNPDVATDAHIKTVYAKAYPFLTKHAGDLDIKNRPVLAMGGITLSTSPFELHTTFSDAIKIGELFMKMIISIVPLVPLAPLAPLANGQAAAHGKMSADSKKDALLVATAVRMSVGISTVSFDITAGKERMPFSLESLSSQVKLLGGSITRKDAAASPLCPITRIMSFVNASMILHRNVTGLLNDFSLTNRLLDPNNRILDEMSGVFSNALSVAPIRAAAEKCCAHTTGPTVAPRRITDAAKIYTPVVIVPYSM